MTNFQISMNLFRMTILSQNVINFVVQFMKIIIRILMNHVSHAIMFFLNDMKVKKSKNNFENWKKIIPDIRKKILQHIQWINEILIDIERSNCIIFDSKSQFCCERLRIIEFVCDESDKHSDTEKILKIVDWSSCSNCKKIRKFIELCVYYRIFIEHFVQIAVPIYRLMKKNVKFVWNIEQQLIMNQLKFIFISSSILIIIDYISDAKMILRIDVNLIDWKCVLMQIFNDLRHSARYDSEMWSDVEKKYDVIKRKCRKILKTLKNSDVIFMKFVSFWKLMQKF